MSPLLTASGSGHRDRFGPAALDWNRTSKKSFLRRAALRRCSAPLILSGRHEGQACVAGRSAPGAENLRCRQLQAVLRTTELRDLACQLRSLNPRLRAQRFAVVARDSDLSRVLPSLANGLGGQVVVRELWT